MNKRLIVITALVLCVTPLVGCRSSGDDGTGDVTDTSSQPNPDSSVTLEDFDGSWYLQEDASRDMDFVILQRFTVDAAAETWTEYSDQGFAGYSGSA